MVGNFLKFSEMGPCDDWSEAFRKNHKYPTNKNM